MLKDRNHSLSEHEAAVFLPCLIEKSGHSIANVRAKMRELMKKITCSHPAASLFPYILEGLHSKDNRTRTECVDLIAYIMDHHGEEV
ncbi:hypothetical protein Scep_028482 [Stephania cephalantha]|uniref:Uncharacterized protein n=1 Tax=Stephania cephalantha TaxID=152367 RepID=A0AAP0HNH3_9MAGN